MDSFHIQLIVNDYVSINMKCGDSDSDRDTVLVDSRFFSDMCDGWGF